MAAELDGPLPERQRRPIGPQGDRGLHVVYQILLLLWRPSSGDARRSQGEISGLLGKREGGDPHPFKGLNPRGGDRRGVGA